MTAIRRVAGKTELRSGNLSVAPLANGTVGASTDSKTDWALIGGVALLTAAAGIVGITYWKERQLMPNPTRLVSSTPTKSAERKIRSAAAAKFGRGRAELWFEHGQWWARLNMGDYDQDYSVVDAYPGVAWTGIDFEKVA